MPLQKPPANRKKAKAPPAIPTLDQLKREQYRRSFYAFVRDFWQVAEPSIEFKDALHIKALCDHFQAVFEGRLLRLNVEIGPGYAKSMIMSVLGPAWIWGPAGAPYFRIISSTQSIDLTVRDSLRFRALVYSPEYQAMWGDTVKPMPDNNKQGYIENTAKGFRISKSVGGKATGHRGHMVITDDTLDAAEAHSGAAREMVHNHMRALSSRSVSPKHFRWINIGQRLHEDDAGGWCRARGFETLCLPSEFDPARACSTSIGFTDWRTTKGELLYPALYDHALLAEAKVNMGPYGYSAQHQQLPVPADGGVLKRQWWQSFYLASPPPFLTVFQSWDTAYTTNEQNDTSACTTWGVGMDGIYLLGVWTGRLEMPQLLEQIQTEAAKHRPSVILIEAKANGLSIIQTLNQNPRFGYSIEPIKPLLDKNSRAHAAAPFVANGRCKLPSDEGYTSDFLAQTDVFPAGKVRDLADSAVQAILYAASTYTFETNAYGYEAVKRHNTTDEDEADEAGIW